MSEGRGDSESKLVYFPGLYRQKILGSLSERNVMRDLKTNK